jgi:hypothetical protein
MNTPYGLVWLSWFVVASFVDGGRGRRGGVIRAPVKSGDAGCREEGEAGSPDGQG